MAVRVSRPLHIAVIGAGIAGLTAVTALRRQGHTSVMYERASRFRPIGAGIQLAPNGTRLLARIGVLEDLAVAGARPAAIELRRWSDDAVIARTALGSACVEAYGAPYLTLHRADLHDRLLRAARPAEARMGSELVRIDDSADGVELAFADGSRTTADVVVGADGVHSAVRAAVGGPATKPSGLIVHRGLVPADRLCPTPEPLVRIWLGPGRHFVHYPIGHGQTSFAAVQNGAGTFAGAYAGWPSDVRSILDAAESVTRWPLLDSPAPACWSTGRVVLIGDAAHPLLPLGAQGANQAIEDAFTLATCLYPEIRRADVPRALRRYRRLRAPRLARVTAEIRGNLADHHVADGPDRASRDRAAADCRSLDSQAWLFRYDAERMSDG
jgi:salicylate hydroxylase